MVAEPENPNSPEARLGWAHDLNSALENDEFFLVYQPNIDLQTNAFAGVEALIRWDHPTQGVLGPDRFIDDLETSGQIMAVGRWALLTACTQGAVWHDRGYRFNVSVNVSKHQLDAPHFLNDVADALSTSKFDPSLLVLEFAQSALVGERNTASLHLEKLKTLGVRVAIDDFEPGESTLDELEQFPIDIVKLERNFIARVATSPDAAAQVHDLVQLCDTRRLHVIASGIEDSTQRERLKSENVHVGQGFLFLEPQEADVIDSYLEDFAIFSGKPL